MFKLVCLLTSILGNLKVQVWSLKYLLASTRSIAAAGLLWLHLNLQQKDGRIPMPSFTGIDPCLDFNEFVCGPILPPLTFRGQEGELDIYPEVDFEHHRKIYQSLTQLNLSDPTVPKFLQQLRFFFDSCRNEMYRFKFVSLNSFLRKLGLNTHNKHFPFQFQLHYQQQILADYGLVQNSFVGMDVKESPKNKNSLLVVMSSPFADMLKMDDSKSFVNASGSVEDSEKHKHLPYSPKEVDADLDEMEKNFRIYKGAYKREEIHDLRKTLLQASTSSQRSSPQLITIDVLQNLVPEVDWQEMIRTRTMGKLPSQALELVIQVDQLKYFRELSNVLKSTKPYNLMIHQAMAVQKEVAELDKFFKGDASSVECVRLLSKEFPLALNYIYARDHLVQRVIEYTRDMIVRLKAAMKELHAKSRSSIENKPSAGRMSLDIKPEHLSETVLAELHEGISMAEGNFLQNLLQAKKLRESRELNRLLGLHRWDVDDGPLLSAAVKGLFDYEINTMNLPLGQMRNTLVDRSKALWYNYGAMGTIIGEMLASEWQEASSEIGLVEKERIESRIVTDITGILSAYYAYKGAAKETQQLAIPGQKYSDEQLFWMAYGSSMCYSFGRLASGYFQDTIQDTMRVNQALSCIQEFARDFKCAADSSLNGERNCTIY